MTNALIRQRDNIVQRADRALDAAWPARTSPEFVTETLACGEALRSLCTRMQAEHLDAVEQSRTHRLLGALYADLEPALGKPMLAKALSAYAVAEDLLLGREDGLEQAKLNFNYANALRLLDPDDIHRLEEAKQRFLAARGYFATKAPEYLPQVDAGLNSVVALIRIAPLAAAVADNARDMQALHKAVADGADAEQIASGAREVMGRGGGAVGLLGRLKTLMEGLPPEQKQQSAFTRIQAQFDELHRQVADGKPPEGADARMLGALNERLEADQAQGKLSGERAETAAGLLRLIGRQLATAGGESLPEILENLQGMRKLADGWIDNLHYLSHGLPRPPVDSRAAALVELCWHLRRFLAEEMNRPGNGEDESKTAMELSTRAGGVDKRLYEAGADDDRAHTVESEELRPLAVAVREYSARKHTMLARPIWASARPPVATDELFYSGQARATARISAIARVLGLRMQAQATGGSPAEGRWTQLRRAMLTIFDLRAEPCPALANVTYELGIALTLGKPIVVLINPGQTMPFDVDVVPVVLDGSEADNALLASEIDRAWVWLYPRPHTNHVPATVDHILASFQKPDASIYVGQMLKLLTEQRTGADPVAIGRTLAKLVDYQDDRRYTLIHPVWPPAYPSGQTARLFHVMPFRPDWANAASAAARTAVHACGGMYVRGDEAEDPDVIASIWTEIAVASHVLVDLTGFNPNVSLELGIAHTLGKRVCMVCQGEPNDHVFPAIGKLRIERYDPDRLSGTLAETVRTFLDT